ncbi:hypothetical protein [Sphingomonas xinjiangensis]|uniref:Uncharacterized protein n=1 Tax=Sphingomonas xinjiangensis TaxID=643568 RepID=A0A840YKQ8_9SPHN|nr:hypothetical protein [Sphingomonas xinjiangensis]MBB5709816.1 hypothetical protein [Sphingomonas xinjiangensis]
MLTTSRRRDDLPTRVLIGFAGIALVVLVCVALGHQAMLAALIFLHLSGLAVVLRAICAPDDAS